MESPMIEISNICYSYGRHQILKNMNLTVEKGDCVGILGSNGCGKSTFLALMAGALKPSSGTIRYGGENPYTHKKLFSHYVGYVPQDPPLIPDLSVRDNLKLWYCSSRLSLKKELEEGFLSLLQIPSFLNVPVHKLSGGIKKRVSLGCALANDPPILLLDEPGAPLDLGAKSQFQAYLDIYRKRKGTLILATHEESEIRLCNQLYLMEKGALRKLASHPSISELAKQMTMQKERE